MTGTDLTPELENLLERLAREATQTIYFGSYTRWVDLELEKVHVAWKAVGGK